MTRPSDIPASIWERADILRDQFRDIADDTEFAARVLMAAQPAHGAGLTESQASVLAFIRKHEAEHGFTPSYEQIKVGVGYGSKSAVKKCIDQLEERGHVTRLPGKSRSLALVEGVAA